MKISCSGAGAKSEALPRQFGLTGICREERTTTESSSTALDSDVEILARLLLF